MKIQYRLFPGGLQSWDGCAVANPQKAHIFLQNRENMSLWSAID